ncbi:DUF397 domain-containing protein [Streptomyces griseus]|uniref:DUF397 domain-containing protein n=1 Tax=Streptomyces griseus TaxID=1911 RepID=UPI0008404C25|nr:DUF397 domain-containing protein [Streptomyces griseus]
MSIPGWQKSSYCGEGESCVHVTGDRAEVALTESSDPSGAVLRTSPTVWNALIRSIKDADNHG